MGEQAPVPASGCQTSRLNRFSSRLSLTVQTNGADTGHNRLDLLYFGPAYTDGDAIIVFPQYNTAFLGELFPGRAVPLIDNRS